MHVEGSTNMWLCSRQTPEARVQPTPFKPHRVVMAASRLGSLRKAFLDSA